MNVKKICSVLWWNLVVDNTFPGPWLKPMVSFEEWMFSLQMSSNSMDPGYLGGFGV